jgi:hypothetical protein
MESAVLSAWLASAEDRPIGETADPQFRATRGVTPAFQVHQVHDARPLQSQACKDVSRRGRIVARNFSVHCLAPSSDALNFCPEWVPTNFGAPQRLFVGKVIGCRLPHALGQGARQSKGLFGSLARNAAGSAAIASHGSPKNMAPAFSRLGLACRSVTSAVTACHANSSLGWRASGADWRHVPCASRPAFCSRHPARTLRAAQ